MLHRDVAGGDTAGQAARQPEPVLADDGSVVLDPVVQRRPRHVAGRDEGKVRVGVGVDDLGDPRAAHLPQRPHLALQAGAGLLVPHDMGTQHLQRHPLAGLLVASQVDHAHAALTELAEDLVGADPHQLVPGCPPGA